MTQHLLEECATLILDAAEGMEASKEHEDLARAERLREMALRARGAA